MGQPRFHLAFPVSDLAHARRFYGELLNCPEGRASDSWVDFDFYGHQITAHLAPKECQEAQTNPVDGHAVPVRHFGAVLSWEEWEALVERMKGANEPFLVEPHVRFAGQPGEQATFFVQDPSGNALEFKAFRRPESVFSAS